MKAKFDQYFLENILIHIPEYVFWKDLNSVYMGCNQNFAELAGLSSPKEIIGKIDTDLPWAQYSKDIYLKEDKKIVETKESITHESVPIIGGDGVKRTIRVSKSPLMDEKNEIVGILGVFHDITELKETQGALLDQIKETKKAYHSKTEFLSITTHEIRNPVGNIAAFNGFLNDKLVKLKTFFYEKIINRLHESEHRETIVEEFNKYLGQIAEDAKIIAVEAYKTLDYLKNLGEIHRLQSEGIKPNFVSIKISDLVERIIKNTGSQNINNIEIVTSLDQSVPNFIEIDYSNIFDALYIIVSNAIRFSPEKSVIKFSFEIANDRLQVAVQDFGEGISEIQIQDLFEDKKSEIKNRDTALYRKPSLRLTQAKIKIEASGGTLKIERMKNGTLVTVHVPYKSENVKNNEMQKESFIKRKILVVEDDPVFQKIEKSIFEDLGHSVSVASRGIDALKMLETESYNIIFLDITLPDMSGVDIIRDIRKKDEELIVIVVTSHAHIKDIEFFEEVGATLALTKPVTYEKFKECLEFGFEDDED